MVRQTNTGPLANDEPQADSDLNGKEIDKLSGASGKSSPTIK